MDSWQELSQLQIIVIDNQSAVVSDATDKLEQCIVRFDEIPSNIDEYLSTQPAIIVTPHHHICRQLVEQAIGCPVYLLLDTVTEETINEAYAAGASDYLLFPLNPYEVLAKTRHLLREQSDYEKVRQQLTTILNYASDAIAMFDRDMRYLYANPAWIESYQLGDTELIGRSHYEIFPEIGEDWKAIHQRCLAGHIDRAEVAPFPREDGTLDWLRWEVRPWYTADNVVGGLLMYTAVITEKVEALQSHQEAESRYTNMIENAGDAILVLQNDRVVYANNAAYDMLGYTGNKLRNLLIWSMIAPDYLEEMQNAFIHFSDYNAVSGRYEIQIINRYNLPVDVELSISRTQYENAPGITIFMRDISERKLNEHIVKQAQSRLEAQAESLITINQIAESLHQSLKLDDLAEITVDVCRKYLNAELAVFLLADYEKRKFKLISSNGIEDSDAVLRPELNFDDSLTGKLITEKRIIITETIAEDDRIYVPVKEALVKTGFKKIISIPALHDGKVLGALNLLFQKPIPMTDETFATLQAIGHTLGLAVSNAQTVARLVQEIEERQLAETALRISDERLKSVITNVPVILFSVDENGVFTLSEGLGLKSIGRESGESVGKSVYELYPDNEPVHAFIGKAIAGEAGNTQVELNGTILDVYYSPLQSGRGATGVCIDVSERTRAARLQESLFNISRATLEAESLSTLLSIVQNELSQLLDTSNFYVALYDPQTELYSFPFWQDEIDRDESLWQPQKIEKSLTNYVRKTGQALIIDEEEHQRLQGQGLAEYVDSYSEIWLGVPLKTSNRIIGVMVVQNYSDPYAYNTRDLDVMRYIGENIAWVIESKQSEEALRTSEERFSKAFFNSPDSLTITIAATGQIIEANEGFEQTFGYTREEAIGKTFLDLGLYANPSRREEVVSQLMEAGYLRNVELRARQKSGTIRDCLISAEMIMLHGEECIVSIVRDISDQKEAERALQSSEENARDFQEKLQALHEISFELTGIDTLDSVFRRAVESGLERLGYDRVGLFLVDLEENIVAGTYGTDPSGQVRDEHGFSYSLSDNPHMLAIMEHGWETRIIRDVTLRDMRREVGTGWNGIATLWDGTKGIGTIAVDNLISQKVPRPFERDLLMMFGAVLGYIISGKQNTLARLKMVEQLQLLNEIDRAILAAQSPQDIARSTIHQLSELLGTDYAGIISLDDENQQYRVLAWTIDDEIPYTVPYSFANDIPTNPRLRRGEIYSIENLDTLGSISPAEQRIYDRGIRSYSTLPLMNDDDLAGVLTIGYNEIAGLTPERLAIARTITTQLALAFRQATLLEQVQAYATDLERLVEERTAQLTAKANELEAFTYSVSHDLRAPLRAISGFVDGVIDDYEDQLDEDGAYYLQRIKYNATRMGTLIDDLLRLSRIGQRELQKKTIQPENTVRAIIEELSSDNQVGNVVFSIESLPECKADPILIKQLWVNLISNAIKYSRSREQAHIEIGAISEEGESIYFIRDNGVGFDMEVADKLFGVFQRLHDSPEYEGSGVGLATVARIIALHRGRVWAESSPDKGATFYFTLAD